MENGYVNTNMVVKRAKPNACGVKLPGGLTGTGLGPKVKETKNKDNTKPPKRGKGSQETN
jgi:hypothetical protein